jgi:hypothetical protein
MTEPKRHHFISQMQLRRFTGPTGEIFSFNKSSPEKGVLKSAPINLFVKRHLYSSIAKDGTKNTELEKQYSKIESAADPVINNLITYANKGRIYALLPSVREAWNKLYYVQFGRVPDLHRKLFNEFDAIFEREIIKFERNVRRLTADERISFRDPKVKSIIEQNARVKSLGTFEGDVLDFIRARGIFVGVVSVPGEELIIGSYPIIALTAADGAPANARGVWLPIAPNVAVSPSNTRSDQLQVWSEPGVVQKINEKAFQQSTIIAGRSRSLIASLVGLE